MDQIMPFVTQNWALCLAFVIIVLLLLRVELSMHVGGVKLVLPHQLTQLLNQSQAGLVDLRDEADFAKGHITGALSLPAALFQGKTQEKQLKKLKRFQKKPLVLYCESGSQSTKIGQLLKTNGFEQVHALKGGVQAWRSANIPLVTNG